MHLHTQVLLGLGDAVLEWWATSSFCHGASPSLRIRTRCHGSPSTWLPIPSSWLTSSSTSYRHYGKRQLPNHPGPASDQSALPARLVYGGLHLLHSGGLHLPGGGYRGTTWVGRGLPHRKGFCASYASPRSSVSSDCCACPDLYVTFISGKRWGKIIGKEKDWGNQD